MSEDAKMEMVTLGALQERQQLSKHSDDDFEKLATRAWLGRLQLMTGASKKCKSKEFPVDHYAYVTGQNYQDLGEAVDVIILAWRPKALDISDEIINVFDPEDPEFKRIQTKSEERDSGCMWGYEFLVWIGDIKKFATMYCASKSARNEARNIKGYMNNAATMRSVFIDPKNSKYSWQAMQVAPCSTPMPMPTVAALNDELEKFNNPVAQELANEDERDL